MQIINSTLIINVRYKYN